MRQPLMLWILGDGKPGHENQSLGLAEAIGRVVTCDVRRIPAESWRGACRMAAEQPRPDAILAAGHATHRLLWWLARRHRAKSVVLMRPSLPSCLFDFVIAPEHDFKKPPPESGRVLATRGALNRVVPADGAARDGTWVLLGGPSKHHGWDATAMRGMIREIAERSSGLEAADSRRTPGGFFDSLEFIETRHHHAHAKPGWLAGRLASAKDVWVTEDSVSMVYEALTGGARVGILPVPRLSDDARVVKGLDRLADDGWVTRFGDWKTSGQLGDPPGRLAEADRAARWLLERMRTPGEA